VTTNEHTWNTCFSGIASNRAYFNNFKNKRRFQEYPEISSLVKRCGLLWKHF
jgi:hypothetical protein